MRKQVDLNGKIINSETKILSTKNLKLIIKKLLSQNNWDIEKFDLDKINSSTKLIMRHKYNVDEIYNLNLFYANIRDESRNEFEKKIQLGKKDPRKLNNKETIIIGVYVIDEDPILEDVIFIGYPIEQRINYNTNPSIRKTFVDNILLKTRTRGFYFDKDTKYVGFNSHFIFYYLDNFVRFHGYDEISELKYENISDLEKDSNKPHQRIFFGAPGTGKSYQLNKEAKECFEDNYERVTFHPNYMYGNFVGAFKPFPKILSDKEGNILKDENGNIQETITYEYIPGPLMRVLVKAFKNKETNYLILIEEINRANVAAIFGDFFQLLDRKENGESEYPITTSEEVKRYLDRAFSDIDNNTRKYINNKIGIEYEKLILPSNLYIWSSMNSADQGVMPMDTAFKRRWDFTYIGIDDVLNDSEIATEFESYRFKISPESTVKWNDFRTEVNKRLSTCGVPEDKLLGPYFISKSILESGDIGIITNTIKNKVLMYLYDDAGKPYRNNLFVTEKSATYSTLCRNFDENGKAIFKNPLDIDDEIITM